MNALRWFLAIPAAVAAWYATLLCGGFTHSYIESHACPPEDLVSGFCTNSNVILILDVTMHVFVAASAIVVLITAMSVAPSRKGEVAWLAFLVGAAVAVYLGVRTEEYGLLASALAGGSGALAVVHWRLRSTCEHLAV